MTRDLVYITDIAGDQVGAILADLVDLWTDERQDQSETLGLTVSAAHPKAGLFVEDAELRYRDRRYRITDVVDERSGAETYVRVEAAGLWVELGDSDLPGTTIVEADPRDGLEAILAGSRWTIGSRTVSGGNVSTIEENDKTRLALLRVWANVTGLSLVWDTGNRTVDLVETRGRELGLAYRYRRNLRGHTRRRRPPEATVVLPLGADDLTIAGVNSGNPELSDFSFYTSRGMSLSDAQATKTRRRVWVDRSFLRETDLLAATERRLATLSAERIEYELDVVDEADISGNREDVRVSDRVRVADPDFDLNVRVTVVRFFRDELDPTRNKVELATLVDPLGLDAGSDRGRVGESWELFTAPIGADLEVRSDGDYFVAGIPLRFSSGGRAQFGVTVSAVGVGAGVLLVSVVDANADPEDVYRPPIRVPYVDGEQVEAVASFSAEDLSGSKSFKVRVTTEADGGPSGSTGVNIAADSVDPLVSSFFIMAQRAVEETLTVPTSITYNYTGAAQSFTVPDNVTEIRVTGGGGKGGGPVGGSGGTVAATYPVVPGTTYDVVVGGEGGTLVSTYPNGGQGGQRNSSHGYAGGGATYFVPTGGTIAAAILVAAGGGGESSNGYSGGIGGFVQGGDGTGPTYDAPNHGEGATQSAPGALALPGDVPSQGWGAARTGDTAANHNGGGGGGGWHGGGAGKGGGGGAFTVAAGGGGGSGWVSAAGTDIEAADGVVAGNGSLVVEWDDDLPNL